MKIRKSSHQDIDTVLLKWFKSQRARSLPINGPLLKEKVEDFGKIMGKTHYKCSESWIQRFRNRNSIMAVKISGETASVSTVVVVDWLRTMWPEIRKGYEGHEIYNADETGLFFKITPDRTLK
ncbi:Tc5 transposase DNA-binding domain [Popillia japonica]|uniref:Tc5 transposase DNA-binding domain n=1 Tax=Popillia japonica TaxID=7064 RepID=A0AAW1IZE6_POPJA